jgi:hypothetical protein
VENIRFSGKRENSIFVLSVKGGNPPPTQRIQKLVYSFFVGVRDLIPFNLLHKSCPTKTNLEKQGPKYAKKPTKLQRFI